MQVLPKNLNDLFQTMNKGESQAFYLKGIYDENFQDMLNQHFNDDFSLNPISKSKFYLYSSRQKVIITLTCNYSTEENNTVVEVEQVWRNPEVLQALLEEMRISQYEITNRIGGRTANKELILVKVDEVRHVFSQEKFEAIGYYVVFNLPKMYDDLLKN